MAGPINLPVNSNTERIPLTIAGGTLAVRAVSPTVELERTADGVILHVTDVDGAKSALIPKGAKGDTGNGIASVTLNADYTLTVVFTDGTSWTSGSIRGERGPKGDPGSEGVPGYSPVKGVDYWTAADKAEIVDQAVNETEADVTALKNAFQALGLSVVDGELCVTYEEAGV